MIKNQKKEFVVKTLKGLEPILYQELIDLGAEEVQIRNRAVVCKGDKRMLYAINFYCRTALRVLVPIKTFKAQNPDEVYDEVKMINWEEYMGVKDTFLIDATVYSDDFRHSKFVAYRTKDAIADHFMERYDKRPSVGLNTPTLRMNIHISQDKCTLSLDSTGESLHKRGWRVASTEAPLSEVLAAGMILKSKWRGESDFYDPMCGSGTLLIEAALIALNIAPGSFRQHFAFERWNDFDEELLQELYEDDSSERTFEHCIYGSDLSPSSIAVAEKNVKSCGLSKYIKLKQQSVDVASLIAKPGVVITNPPYDERLKVVSTETLYGVLGRTLKHHFVDCQALVLAYRKEDLYALGLKPSDKLLVKNGDLDCLLYQYELFSGKREEQDLKPKALNRSEHDRKPFRKREDGDRKPFRREDGDRKPFRKREDGDRKPFRREDGDRKPFRKREDGDRKPFRREDGDRKPFRKREDGDRKPFRREDGDRKPFRKREDGDRKPFRREDGDRKPFRKREDGDRKPFKKREGSGTKIFRKKD